MADSESELNEGGYSTSSELEFLHGLGSHSIVGPSLDRADLLRGYLAGAAQRDNWSRIDKQRVVYFAKEQLAAEHGAVENSLNESAGQVGTAEE